MKAGWRNCRLGDLSDVITKGTTPTSVGFQFAETGINFVKVESVTSDHRLNPARFAKIDSGCHAALRRSQIHENDILFSIAGALGRCAIANTEVLPANTNQALAIVRLSDLNQSTPEYVLYALQSAAIVDQIERDRAGSAQQNLSLKQVSDFQIPLPPLEEQRRIVAVLDKAFAAIATATANARKNLTNARALFESYLRSIINERGDGWTEYSFDQLCSISSKLVDPRLLTFIDLPHVGAGNMESRTGGIIDVLTAREEGLKSGKFLFDPSMVLYSKIRPYLMKACRPDFSGLCSADVYPLVPKAGLLDRDMLFHILMSDEFTAYAEAGSARAGMPKVNRDHLFKYTVWLPDIKTQKAICNNLDDLTAKCQNLAAIYQSKLDALTELKQSLLHKAFAGELT
jgi:type I restriction enzyme, S subunit